MKGLVMGRMVRYVDRNTDGTGTGTYTVWPAVIVRVKVDSVNLVFFNDEFIGEPAAVRFNVAYNEGPNAPNSWHWPPKDE